MNPPVTLPHVSVNRRARVGPQRHPATALPEPEDELSSLNLDAMEKGINPYPMVANYPPWKRDDATAVSHPVDPCRQSVTPELPSDDELEFMARAAWNAIEKDPSTFDGSLRFKGQIWPTMLFTLPHNDVRSFYDFSCNVPTSDFTRLSPPITLDPAKAQRLCPSKIWSVPDKRETHLTPLYRESIVRSIANVSAVDPLRSSSSIYQTRELSGVVPPTITEPPLVQKIASCEPTVPLLRPSDILSDEELRKRLPPTNVACPHGLNTMATFESNIPLLRPADLMSSNETDRELVPQTSAPFKHGFIPMRRNAVCESSRTKALTFHLPTNVYQPILETNQTRPDGMKPIRRMAICEPTSPRPLLSDLLSDGKEARETIPQMGPTRPFLEPRRKRPQALKEFLSSFLCEEEEPLGPKIPNDTVRPFCDSGISEMSQRFLNLGISDCDIAPKIWSQIHHSPPDGFNCEESKPASTPRSSESDGEDTTGASMGLGSKATSVEDCQDNPACDAEECTTPTLESSPCSSYSDSVEEDDDDDDDASTRDAPVDDDSTLASESMSDDQLQSACSSLDIEAEGVNRATTTWLLMAGVNKDLGDDMSKWPF